MRHSIISPGGTGTNYLYHIFGKDNLSGGISHAFNPHQRYPHKIPGNKIIYLGGHPLNILMSAERRGFFKAPHHVTHIGANVNKWMIHKITSLSKYIDVGENLFNFGDHFLGWHNSGFIDKVIDYDWMDNNGVSLGLRECVNYLQGEGHKALERQPITPRTSDRWEDLDPTYKTRLLRMHKEDIEIYNKYIRELIYE